jgi:hypothetical protein
MHSDNRDVDHLDSCIVGSGKCVYDAAPDTSPPPADETVISSGMRAERLRQIAPRHARSQDRENTVEDTTVVHPRNAARLVGQHWLDGSPFMFREFVAHDSPPVASARFEIIQDDFEADPEDHSSDGRGPRRSHPAPVQHPDRPQ